MKRVTKVVSVMLLGIMLIPTKVKADVIHDVPQAVVDAAEKYGKEYNIQPEFLEAIAWYESNYKPTVSNRAGTCHGLMQISYSAHGDRMKKLGVTDIFNLDGNMHIAADYLAELFEEYEDPAIVLAIYNGQSEAKIARIERGELSEYTINILTLSRELEVQHGK